MRWGPGPVFVYECLANSRRWQTYALRAAGVAGLLCAMATIASSRETATANSWNHYAELGQRYFIAMIGVELALVVLAAPAATAGAICLDRARGTLAHMLMTDLSDPEIVLGKLAARLLPVLGLVACTWPVMAISSLLGGIDPIALTLAFANIVTVAVLGCSMALFFSVWARKSHEVILATYTVFILCILFWPIWYVLAWTGWVSPAPDWGLLANPFYVAFAPYAAPGKLEFWDYLIFFVTTLGTSIVVTAIAVWRMRPVACRGSVEKSKGPRVGWMGRAVRWLPGPSLDRNPVLWREWHRSRPTRWMTAIVGLLMGTTFVLCVGAALAFWINGVHLGPGHVWPIVGICSYMLHIIFGLLMLAAIAPTSMAEERQRGSLDLLAATALSTRDIVIGKWLGTFRLIWPVVIAPGLLAMAMATARSPVSAYGPGLPPDYYRRITLGARCYGAFLVVATILAHGALITSVGLALAVWVKRQSRAIALSVGWFILVTAVLPIVMTVMLSDGPDRGEAFLALSPVAVCGNLVTLLTQRTYAFTRGTLWSGTIWAVELSVLAIGLLWLTIRTFDGCFDRIPDQPRRISGRTLEILILTGSIGVGSLAVAVGCWIEGVEPARDDPAFSGILAFSLLIAIGLLLVGAGAAGSGRPSGLVELADAGTSVAVRRFILRRWWRSFCLVLLLAIGPAVLAFALATAHVALRYDPQVTKDARGATTVTYVLRSNLPYTGEVLLGHRLMLAALLLATILAHGGAAVSVGQGLATVSGWSRRAMAGVAAIAVLAALVLPLVVFVLNSSRPLDTAGGSFAMALSSILAALVTRTSFQPEETLLLVAAWDIATALFAIGLSAWTIWFWQHKANRAWKIKRSQVPELADALPGVEAGFVGD
jgi:ABC-type transport system involved in multi-copper enzyme maturation permease subunit